MSTTILTITMKELETTVHFNPPSKQVKEIQLLDYHGPKERFTLFCSIDYSHHFYSNFGDEDSKDNVNLVPSKVLATIPSQNYPSVPIERNLFPVNHFTLTIVKEKAGGLDLNTSHIGSKPITLCLMISY